MNVEWDAGRRVLVAPFKIISGQNRITLLAHLEPPNGNITDWQMGFSGGTIVLAGNDRRAAADLQSHRHRSALRHRQKRRVLLTQADISNGEIGVAGTGSIDYSGEPRLTLGFAGTPMSASALKRMWPTPDRSGGSRMGDRPGRTRLDSAHRDRGQFAGSQPFAKRAADSGRRPRRQHRRQRRDVAAGRWLAAGARCRFESPCDRPHRDGDRSGRRRPIRRRAASSTFSDLVFEVPDMAPKPAPARVKFRIDGPVPAAAEILASDRLSEFSGDPDRSQFEQGNGFRRWSRSACRSSAN